MRSALVGGLSAQALQTALRKTTERLAAELADPAAATPDWSAAEWRVACAAATIHGAAPLLASRLRWQGPAHWRQFLHEQAVRAGARHRHMLELTSLIDATLHAAGIPAVALKGAALYAGALYQPGMRPMADVDLLVRGADFEGATQALLGLGCQRVAAAVEEPGVRPACGCRRGGRAARRTSPQDRAARAHLRDAAGAPGGYLSRASSRRRPGPASTRTPPASPS